MSKRAHQHAWTFWIINWNVCSKCGLIALKNKRTRKAMKKRCPGSEDYDK